MCMFEHFMWQIFCAKINFIVLFCSITFRTLLDFRLYIPRPQASMARGLGKVALLTRQTRSSHFSLSLRSIYAVSPTSSPIEGVPSNFLSLKSRELNTFHDFDINFIISILITYYYSKPLPLHIHALSPSLVILPFDRHVNIR